MSQIRRPVRIIAFIIGVLLFAGCVQSQEYPGELPMPEMTPPPTDSDLPRSIQASLYFLSEDGTSLEAETRSIRIARDKSPAYAAIEALCAGPSDISGLSQVVPDTLELSAVELSGDICNVYFTGAADLDELLKLRAALASTVHSAQGIAYTDVFIDGVQPGFNGRPLGALSPIDVPLETYLQDLGREYALIPSTSEADTFETHQAALYFSDTAGELLLCDVRTVYYSKSADGPLIVSALLIELMKGPLNSEGREWLLPADMRLRKVEFTSAVPEIDAVSSLDQSHDSPDISEDGPNPPPAASRNSGGAYTSSGPYMVELYFDRPQSVEKEAMAYASLVYTITGFIPDVAGVKIYLGGELDTQALPENEAYTRADFANKPGQLVRLCFPDKNGQGLHSVRRSMKYGEVYDPKARLNELFTGAADPGVRFDAFGPEDVLCANYLGNMIVINFAPGFYEKLTTFMKTGAASVIPTHTRARMFVFSVVNTMCALPGVSRVWMLEDGERIDESVDMIYLGGPLYENPGLILQ